MLEQDKLPAQDSIYGEQRSFGRGQAQEINESKKEILEGVIGGQKKTYNRRVVEDSDSDQAQ